MSARHALALLLLLFPPARAGALDAAEVKKRWMERLDGRSFAAKITLSVDSGGMHEERRAEVWRDDQGGLERLMARFEAPAEIRGLGLLYLEQQGRPNDYFVYQPATKRIRRVPDVMAREDSYGVDLEYLGFGVAQIEPTQIDSIQEEVLRDHPTLRLEERAVNSDARFDRRIVWLDPQTYIPLRTEHYREQRQTLVATTESIETIQGVPTPRHVRFERPQEHQVVEMQLDEIDYLGRIPEAFFTTLRLLSKP